MINACLIGCGRMGQSHAAHIHTSPYATLHSVVDMNPQNSQAVAEKYGAKIHNSVDEALKDPEVDAVVIATTTATHADLIMASAKALKPIFCEKPIALDLNLIDQCLEVVDKFQVPLFVAFNRRFDSSFRNLKNKIDEGLIGPIEILSISSRDAPLPEIAFLRTSGGMFKDMTIHDFDMVRWLLGEEPVEVYGSGSCLVYVRLKEFGDIDTAMITLKTDRGAICNINNSRRAVYGYDQRIEAFGPKGMLRAHNVSPTAVEFSCATGVIADNPHSSFLQRYEKAYNLEINCFFKDVVIDGKKPEVSGIDGRQAIVIAEAANRSLEEKRPVEIPVLAYC